MSTKEQTSVSLEEQIDKLLESSSEDVVTSYETLQILLRYTYAIVSHINNGLPYKALRVSNDLLSVLQNLQQRYQRGSARS